MPNRVRVKLGEWNRLGRPWAHRVSMMKTMVTQLLERERIRTTLAKAKMLQRYADQAITLGKKGTRDAWVQAGGIIRTDRELHKLFTTLALRYHARPGGYTRLLRAGWRQHDAAPAAFVELVDRPGELRPAGPATQPVPLFSVARWVRTQLGQPLPPPQPQHLLPATVQAYLKEENKLQRKRVPSELLPGLGRQAQSTHRLGSQ